MTEPSIFSQSIYPNPNKVYSIIPIFAQHMGIDIDKGDSKEGTKVQIWKRHNGKNQKFKLILNNEFDCTIEPLHCKNRALDVKGGQVKSGNNIQLWKKNGTKAQSFRIIKNNDNSYTFLSSLDYNYAIDVYGKKSNNGSDIVLHKRNNTDAQKFILCGENVLNNALEYALQYAEEPDIRFKDLESNGANFCSQCLFAGGEDENNIWNRNSDIFINGDLLKDYYIGKGIDWLENAKIEEASPGDIVYTKFEKEEFCCPVFFISNLKRGFVFCGNNPNFEINKGILNMKIVPGILKTSQLFRKI